MKVTSLFCFNKDTTATFKINGQDTRTTFIGVVLMSSIIRASRIRNLGTRFFVHLITCLLTRSYTFYFMHLKQLFVQVYTLTCTLPHTLIQR